MSQTLTLADIESMFSIKHHDHLPREAEVPVVTNLAMQGDVAIVRVENREAVVTPIPQAGFPVVRGENGGNTHALFGPGFAKNIDTNDTTSNTVAVAVLTVPAGEQTLLSHPEHGGLLLDGGAEGTTWEFRRQVEQTDVIRRVAD